jgi:hypothetical protein
MFKCEICGIQVDRGISPIMVVTKIREKKYPIRYKNPSRPVASEKIDNGGVGYEIVRECKTCGCTL